jgi:hypothetical protein
MGQELMKYITSREQPVQPEQPVHKSSAVNLKPHELLEHISKTRSLMAEYKEEIKQQRLQKELIKSSNEGNEDKKRKLHNLARDIMTNKKWVSTLTKTLTHQQLQLESITKNDAEDNTNDDSSVSNESGMSDLYNDNK